MSENRTHVHIEWLIVVTIVRQHIFADHRITFTTYTTDTT